MPLDERSLRDAVLAVSHIPGVALEIATRSHRYRVARQGAADITLATLRDAIGAGPDVLVTEELAGGPVEFIVVLDDPPAVVRRGERWWQQTCICGVTDFVISDLHLAASEDVVENLLGPLWDEVPIRMWIRRDPHLDATVLSVERPIDLPPEQTDRLDRHVATLEVLCAVPPSRPSPASAPDTESDRGRRIIR